MILFILYLFILPFMIIAHNHTIHPHIVHDAVEPPLKRDEQGAFTSTSILPDWSDIKVNDHYYIELLLGIDAAVARYYGHDEDKILSALTSLMHAVNMYAHKLNIHIVVVDVVPIRGYNVSLEQFLEWRQETEDLTSHDVAMLMRHRYEGGIAYVDGICKRTAVGLCGFFPEAPYEYASVFFHELVHLIGLSHDMTVPCTCSKKNRKNCLRIDGFEKDCSAQALVDLLPKATCLSYPKEPLPRTTMSVCGNAIVEDEEDCDCGPEGQCFNIFCDVRSCRFVVDRKYLYSTFTFGSAAFICLILLIIKRLFCFRVKSVSSTSFLIDKKPFSDEKPQVPISFMSSLPKLRSDTEITVLPSCAMQLPCLAPTRSAPKRPTGNILDMQIPLTHNDIITSEYVKMNPIKNPILDSSVRLPCINPSLSLSSTSLKSSLDSVRQSHREKSDRKLEISRPIALIVQSKSTEDFLESFEEASRTWRIPKKSSDDTDRQSKTLPRAPPVPERRTKPSLASLSQISLGDCPIPNNKKHMYDLPPL